MGGIVPVDDLPAAYRPSGIVPLDDLPISLRPTAQKPREAVGAIESIQAGYQGSAVGMVLRGGLPDLISNPQNASWWERALSGITGIGVDIVPVMVPGMIAGRAAGTAVGAAAGSAVPAVGTAAGAAIGGVLGGGAGMMGFHTAVRESLMQAYKSGEAVTPGDWWNILRHTAESMAVGAATFGAGAVAARGIGSALAPAIGKSVSVPTATNIIGTSDVAAQIATMTTMPAVMEGRLPTAQEFLDAAIIIGGLKAAHVVAAKLPDIFVKTGKSPAEVVVDAKSDPKIEAELKSAETIPRAYEQQAQEVTVNRIVPDQVSNERQALNIEAFLAKPQAEVPLDKVPNYLNFRYIEAPQDVKATSARVTELFEAQIEAARGKETWDQTKARAEELIARSAGMDQAAIDALSPDVFRNLAAKGMATLAMSQRAAFDVADIAKKIEQEGATAENTRSLVVALETSALLSAVDQGAGAEIARALNARKAARQTAELAKQFSDLATKYGVTSEPKALPIFDAKAPFAKNTIFTTERVEAARALLKSKLGQLNAGLDPEVFQAGLTIAGGYIEAGLRSFADFSKAMVADIGDGIKPHLQELYDAAIKEVPAPDMAVTYGGDAATLAKMINRLKTPEQVNEFAKNASKATTWEKVVEAWKASILSGPVTQMANIIGNTTFLALRPIIDATASVLGTISGTKERVAAAEPMARAIGNMQGAVDALKYTGELLKLAYDEGGIKGVIKEIAVGKEPDAALKAEQFRKAIPGPVGDVIRLPFRALSVTDEFFRTLNERGEAYSLAAREATREGLNPLTREFRERIVELVQNPTADMQKQITAAGKRFTFNDDLGEFGKSVQSAVKAGWFGTQVAPTQMIVPFIRTPMNILTELTRMTALAPLVKEWRADIAKGGAERQKAIAELAFGTSIAAVVAMYAMDSKITGAGDPDPNKRRTQMAAGWQPYSIKVGDTYYNYQRIQPIGTLIGIAADMVEIWDKMSDDEMDALPKMLAVAFSNAVTNQTFLQGLTNVANALSDPKRFVPRMAQQYAGSIIPNIIAQPTAMNDPVVREVNSMLDAIKARIPGERDKLLPKIDVFGQPIETKERLGGTSPVVESKESTDKVRTEAARLDISLSDTPKKMHIGKGTGKLGDVELTPEERNKFAVIGGKMAHSVLTPIVNSPEWDALPVAAKRKVYRDVMMASHKFAAAQALPMDKRLSYIRSITENMQVELTPEGSP